MSQSRALDDLYTAVALDLLRQSVQASGATRLPVTGDSMLPLLRPGDAVWLVAIDPAALQPGDLVLVRQHGVLLAHRLIALGPRGWQTKGDNNRLADQPATAEQIQGRIVALERGGPSIDMQRHGWRIANRLLARISRLEQRCLTPLHPEARLLAYILDTPFRLLRRAVVMVAVRC